VLGKVDDAMLKRLTSGVKLVEGQSHFEQLIEAGGQGANHWYHVVLTEGRHHEVRELWESQGVQVSRLIRVRFGTILLPRGLKAGHYQALSTDNMNSLLRQVGL
jgi:23S rRNA pseudouridine2605 synthase